MEKFSREVFNIILEPNAKLWSFPRGISEKAITWIWLEFLNFWYLTQIVNHIKRRGWFLKFFHYLELKKPERTLRKVPEVRISTVHIRLLGWQMSAVPSFPVAFAFISPTFIWALVLLPNVLVSILPCLQLSPRSFILFCSPQQSLRFFLFINVFHFLNSLFIYTSSSFFSLFSPSHFWSYSPIMILSRLQYWFLT